uniref:Uncharacterized protein n=1 Tax=Arundo donax TaxID=35708 RepID=A0A0A8YA91_ARUDO
MGKNDSMPCCSQLSSPRNKHQYPPLPLVFQKRTKISLPHTGPKYPNSLMPLHIAGYSIPSMHNWQSNTVLLYLITPSISLMESYKY